MIEVDGLKAYNLKEISEMLNVTYRTMQNYVLSGKLRAKKVGGKWHVTTENLKAFISPDDKKGT